MTDALPKIKEILKADARIKKDIEEMDIKNGVVEEENSIDVEDFEKNFGEAPIEDEFTCEYPDHTGLIGYYERYQKSITNAPRQFGIIMLCKLIGHAMGKDCIHEIQPKSIRHNMYIALIGPSTTGKKTTAQDIARGIDNPNTFIHSSMSSPEGILRALSQKPQCKLYLGEFSNILRSMTKGGYMAGLREVLNDLYGYDQHVYQSLRANQNNDITIEDPYLSASTTITPAQLFSNLDEETIMGGFLPRFLCVYGNSTYRDLGYLPTDTVLKEEYIRKRLEEIRIFFAEHKVIFKLDKKALKRYNEIFQQSIESKEYAEIRPFTERYMWYIIKIADILCVSEIFTLQEGNEKILLNSTNTPNKPTKSTTQTLEDFSQSFDDSFCEPRSSDEVGLVANLSFSMFKPKTETRKNSNGESYEVLILHVPVEFIEIAYKTIKPSLDYAKEIAKNIFEEKFVSKVDEKLKSYGPMMYSELGRYSHLKKRDLKEAFDTLKERRTAFELQYKNKKNNKTVRFCCHKDHIETIKCKKCYMKDRCNSENRIYDGVNKYEII